MLREQPFLTDEDLADGLGVSVATIRLDRTALDIPEVRVRLRKAAAKNAHSAEQKRYTVNYWNTIPNVPRYRC